MNEPVARYPVIASSRIAFSGHRPEFRRLLVRGALLELVTVGFYRFWLATDMRRHLWSSTSVADDALEYTGTAKELLIGFLFALAILVPIYVIYFLVGLEAERAQAFASIPLILFFYLFAQFAVYRARRYRLTRTVWRGVRFWMAGSGMDYAWRAAIWSLLVVISLGFALPWRQAALERFKMRHTSYGDLPGRFDGTGAELFKRGWWLWVMAIAAVVAQSAAGAHPKAVFFAPLFLIAGPFIYAAFKAIEWQWWVSGIRFGDVRFEADMARGALIGLYWKVVGWFALLLVGLMMWFAVVGGIAYGLSEFTGSASQKIALSLQHPAVLVGMVLGYVGVALALNVVVRLYLTHDVWEQVAASATVHHLDAAENVTAQGRMVSALGEGFADSLDVGGF
jgi:uncharacterized membrane protein YjgN (DUF898 family)